MNLLGALGGGIRKIAGRAIDMVPPPVYANPKRVRPRPGSDFARGGDIEAAQASVKLREQWEKDMYEALYNQPSFWEEMEDLLTTLSKATKCDWEIFWHTDQLPGLDEGWAVNCGHMAGPLQDILKVVSTTDLALGPKGRSGQVTVDVITYHQVQKDDIEARGDDVAHFRV